MQIKQLLSCSMVVFIAACSSSDNDSVVVDESTAVSENTAPVAPVAPVAPTAPASPTAPDFIIADSAFELIRDLASYKPDQVAGVVADLATITTDTAIGSPEVLTGGEFSTFDTNEGDVITQTTRTLYQCSGGGTLTFETGTLNINLTGYSHDREVNQYDFDQCQFEVTNNRVAMGSYSANGTLHTSESFISGSGFGEAS